MTAEEYIDDCMDFLPDEDGDLWIIQDEIESHLINFLEENTPKWIPVSERLPEFNQFNNFKTYLVTEDENCFISHYDQNHKKFCYMNNNGLKIFINVIAWQPLPEPFKKDV